MTIINARIYSHVTVNESSICFRQICSRFQGKGSYQDKEQYCILIKRSIVQEDIIILNVHELNNRISNYVRQRLMEFLQSKKQK